MTHGLRAAAFLALPLLIFAFVSRVSAVTEELPMQLSRAEFVHMAGYGEERLSSVLVAGVIQCDACLEPGSYLRTSDVSGAKVAVACKAEGKRKRINWAHGTTDESGEFMVHLPSQLHAMPSLEDSCIVRVLHTSKNSLCRRASRLKSRRIKLSSIGNGIRVYTAGTVRLQHKSKPSYECSGMRDRLEATW